MQVVWMVIETLLLILAGVIGLAVLTQEIVLLDVQMYAGPGGRGGAGGVPQQGGQGGLPGIGGFSHDWLGF